ncbi:hypothetical protein BGW38_005444 [Lunasporangiospora selenospora]|uniref:Uncharacterized protein n=1 Tax=Lunasporangiospora selenospora TaxID=979761 RepID=A0A9P6FMZ8_9FUNG|nr:hypothetical protein BGW38_005444 [Lunasporangiospora selenospora]
MAIEQATQELQQRLRLDDETRDQEIVNSLRAFLKHQTERVSLYKEFNDAFKEYLAKRLTAEEYTTICQIVTDGFVELSVEILALEAHLGGPDHTSNNEHAGFTSTIRISLDSPEHAQLIRQVQVLEKQKLGLTIQGQKWALNREAREKEDEKEKEEEKKADRIAGQEDAVPAEATETTSEGQDQSQPQSSEGGNGESLEQLSMEEWDARLCENKERLNQVIEEINEKLADIQEAIAIFVL